jgi:hypothetical protein
VADQFNVGEHSKAVIFCGIGFQPVEMMLDDGLKAYPTLSVLILQN